MEIKNIIFDLGGVIIDLKRDNAVKALEKLGIPNVDKLLGEYSQQGEFLKLEQGKIDSSEFYDYLLPQCKKGTTCTEIRDAFEDFLVDIPESRLKNLDDLKKNGYRLFILSNTNPIMYNHWIHKAFQKNGKSINDYFEGIVTSFQEGMCKPEPELFKRVIERYDLKPSETLMLDDSQANVDAAKSVGLNAIKIEADNFFDVTSQLL